MPFCCVCSRSSSQTAVTGLTSSGPYEPYFVESFGSEFAGCSGLICNLCISRIRYYQETRQSASHENAVKLEDRKQGMDVDPESV